MSAPEHQRPAFPLPIAASIRPADRSDTTILDPRPENQISLGAVALRRHDDIGYSTVAISNRGERELRLDLLRPATDDRLPLVVYVPGGGFMFADKSNAPALRGFVAEAGFVVANVEYRTATDGASYAESVRDIRAAVAFLRAHAEEYGIDARAAGLWGESAGGYLAAMAGVTNDLDRYSGPRSDDRIDAVVDSFGASDFFAIGVDFDDDSQAYFRDNVTHFSAYLGAPGRTLPEIPDHVGADSSRYLLDGANHGDIAFLGLPNSGLPWSSTTTMGIITAFLHRHLDRS